MFPMNQRAEDLMMNAPSEPTSDQLMELGCASSRRIFSAFHGADAMWDYMPIGPFETEADLADWIAQVENSEDPLFFTFTPVGEAAAGFGSYLRIAPAAGVDRGRLSLLLASLATQRRGDGGDVPDDEMGLRGRVSPLRVEV
jgi:hypothetical protein